MTDSKSSIRHEDILYHLQSFSDDEKAILKAMGRITVSVKKNVALHTIFKKLPEQYIKSGKKCIEGLCAKGFIIKYRKENYGLSQKGRDVANYLTNEDMKNKYNDLRILLLI